MCLKPERDHSVLGYRPLFIKNVVININYLLIVRVTFDCFPLGSHLRITNERILSALPLLTYCSFFTIMYAVH